MISLCGDKQLCILERPPGEVMLEVAIRADSSRAEANSDSLWSASLTSSTSGLSHSTVHCPM